MRLERKEQNSIPQEHLSNSPAGIDVETILSAYSHIPVAAQRDLLRQKIREHQDLVLVGRTGSGKTTCLPPLLLEYRQELGLFGKIGITQPRRVATRNVTAREAEMFSDEVGNLIGYQVRFDNMTSEDTEIVFMTDGLLLRQIQFDPYLTDYSMIMVDEAHEESLNIILTLGLLKRVNLLRQENNLEPLHIIVSSATIEEKKYSRYLNPSDPDNSIEIPGIMHPMEIFYEEHITPNYDYMKAAAVRARKVINEDSSNDILIFMPGKPEIARTIDYLYDFLGDDNVEILPLHAELSPEDQDKMFQPSSKRKIIVATNIAQASITPQTAVDIIDSGLIKQIQFDPKSGIEKLVTIPCSLSDLEQRGGRGGRTGPGKCYRLFPEESLSYRPKYPVSELQRCNLTQVVLAMKKVGIEDVQNFDFIDPPNKNSLTHAIETLTILEALDSYGNLTEIGEFIFQLSIEPHLGRMIIESLKPENNCLNEICIIASLLDGKNIFIRPTSLEDQIAADKAHNQFRTEKDSDFITLLNIWKGYANHNYDPKWAVDNYLNEKVLQEATNLREELISILASHGIHLDPRTKPRLNKEAIGRSITAGLIDNLIIYQDKTFSKADGTAAGISIHPSSNLSSYSFKKGELIICGEIFTTSKDKTYACNNLVVTHHWVRDIFPQLADTIFKHRGRGSKRNHNFGGRNRSRRH